MALMERVYAEFAERFGSTPEVLIRAPGRVNLIGEHTDYNDGFVLPMAIDLEIWIALRPRLGGEILCHSIDFQETLSFDLDDIQAGEPRWVEYVKGCAWVLQMEGFKLQAWEGVLSGNIPIGAGLSSSAAIEMATLRAFSVISDLPWDWKHMARLGQRAENEWLGIRSGIMDQMISAGGKPGHCLLMDCRSLESDWIAMPEESLIVVLDTNTRRGLVESEYNQRRAECEEAAKFFQAGALRDVTKQEFERHAHGLDSVVRNRARHVITENERTLRAVEALKKGDLRELGSLMSASHASLRDDFEVSSKELDAIVSIAITTKGCLGARMTGAGFGGCAIALVRPDALSGFISTVEDGYRREVGLEAGILPCQPSAGVQWFEGG
jgi:galactokinase